MVSAHRIRRQALLAYRLFLVAVTLQASATVNLPARYYAELGPIPQQRTAMFITGIPPIFLVEGAETYLSREEIPSRKLRNEPSEIANCLCRSRGLKFGLSCTASRGNSSRKARKIILHMRIRFGGYYPQCWRCWISGRPRSSKILAHML